MPCVSASGGTSDLVDRSRGDWSCGRSHRWRLPLVVGMARPHDGNHCERQACGPTQERSPAARHGIDGAWTTSGSPQLRQRPPAGHLRPRDSPLAEPCAPLCVICVGYPASNVRRPGRQRSSNARSHHSPGRKHTVDASAKRLARQDRETLRRGVAVESRPLKSSEARVSLRLRRTSMTIGDEPWGRPRPSPRVSWGHSARRMPT